MAFTVRNQLRINTSGYVIPYITGSLVLNQYDITSSATFYVNSSSGNDSTGDGSSGAPWKTLAGSFSGMRVKSIAPGVNVTLQLANGTYSGATARDLPYTIILNGNVTTPNNVYITGFLQADRGSYLKTQYLKVFNTVAYYYGVLDIGTNTIFAGDQNSHMYAADYGIIRITGNYSVTSGAWRHMNVDAGMIFVNNGLTATFTGTPAFSNAVVGVERKGIVRFHQYYVSRLTFSGGATGTRYWSDSLSMIDSMGGGANYIPGNIAGATNNGGIYI